MKQRSNKFCFLKIERAITIWGAMEKSPISLLLKEHSQFHSPTKLFLHFESTNNIFADCILLGIDKLQLFSLSSLLFIIIVIINQSI